MKYAMQMMRTYPKHNGRHNVNNRSPPALCKKHCNYFPLLCRLARYIQEFPLTRNGQHGQHPRVLECSTGTSKFTPLGKKHVRRILHCSGTPPPRRTKEAPAKHRPKRQTKSVLQKNAEVSSSAQIMACVRARGISPYGWLMVVSSRQMSQVASSSY